MASSALIYAILTYSNAYPSARLDKLVRQDLLLTMTVVSVLTILDTLLGAYSLLKHSKKVYNQKNTLTT